MNTKTKRVLLILAAAAAAVLLVGIIIYIVSFDINAYKPQIEAAASEATGMNVRINGRMKLMLFPGAGISLEDITIQNEGMDVALAKKAEVGMKFLPLIRRQVLVERVGLHSPTFFVTEDKKGRFNFETPGRHAGPFAVGNLSIRGGNLLYSDEKSGARTELNKCDLDIQDLSAGTGSLLGTLSFDGNLSCGEAKVKGLRMSDVRITMNTGRGKFDANHVTMKIFGGDGEGKITLAMPDDRPQYVVDFAITRFRFEEVLRMFDKRRSISGEINLKAHLALTGKNTDEAIRAAQGKISLRGKNLLLTGFNIDRLLDKYKKSTNVSLIDIGASLIAGPLGMVLTKGYEFGSLYQETLGGESTIRELNSDWNVKNGIAEAQDVALTTQENRIALKGRIDFVKERFDNVTVAVLDEKGCVRYSQKMQGSFSHPQTEEVSILRTITGPMMNLYGEMNKLITGGRCEVFYTGSVKQPKE